MPNRRDFFKGMATATAGLFVGGRRLVEAGARSLQPGTVVPRRRQVSVGGRRVKVVDVHAHCFIPEVADIIKGTNLAAGAPTANTGLVLGPDRIRAMDEQGVDVEALSINAFWYSADRELADRIVKIQNEKLAQWCAAHPDRFVGLASVALQHPDLAAVQLDDAIKKLGLHGVAIGGSVEGEELSSRKFDPFWAMAEKLGTLIFMHPQPAPGTTQNARLEGRGGLGNVIGNPLETTVFLSHMIFEGTLDRFPGLRICGAHAGGYLASYSGRTDAVCGRGSGADCRSLKKRPSEYFKKEIYADAIIFHEEGLRHLVAECGVSQIVYGTDYPFDWPVNVDFVLNTKLLSNADKEAILGGNASKLLRIS
jgi:aminocarboxymuconate-semialdehyde decarboxylase